MTSPLILGIETSCDETGIAVLEGMRVRSSVLASQVEMHARFGGVVPEVASREHIKRIEPLFREALRTAEKKLDEIQLVAATRGPGLIGPLLVGLSFAKGLAFAKDLPFVAVNHMEGHLAANILEHEQLKTEHLTLIVSGGHTMLVHVKRFGQYAILGSTMDDAAGEAFDKVAKILGLGYPGGKQIDDLSRTGDPHYFKFPRSVMKEGYAFSHSGLKTAVALHVEQLAETELEKHRADIAASFQEALVEVLVEKTVRAAEELKLAHVTISGGVAANSRLRNLMNERLERIGRRLFYPSFPLCTDNGAMIAAAGYYQFQNEGASEFVADAVPYLPIETTD